MTLTRIIAATAAFGLLASCGDKEEKLQGERLDIRPVQNAAAADATAANRAATIKLPATVNHKQWTHRGGTASHKITHPALAADIREIWSSSIGAGENRKHRITADPVVGAGRIFTLDAMALVMAHDAKTGAAIWTRDLTPPLEKSGQASGGGLALKGNRLYVTTGYGDLIALDVKTGAKIWTQHLEAAATGAPSIRGDIIYLTARDSRAWALDADTGRVKWQLPASPSASVLTGGTSPAVGRKYAVFPFGSGELITVFRKGGLQIWATSVSGGRSGHSYAKISGITSDPVIFRGVVYAANQSGRLVAINLNNGERIWTAPQGAYSPVWPVGNSVFLVSDQAHLVRLDRRTGQRIWSVEMPYFLTDRVKARKAVHAYYGPVLAGGRLIVASSDGEIKSFSPTDGAQVSTLKIAGGATTNPVIVDGMMYIVSTKGQLHAFR